MEKENIELFKAMTQEEKIELLKTMTEKEKLKMFLNFESDCAGEEIAIEFGFVVICDNEYRIKYKSYNPNRDYTRSFAHINEFFFDKKLNPLYFLREGQSKKYAISELEEKTVSKAKEEVLKFRKEIERMAKEEKISFDRCFNEVQNKFKYLIEKKGERHFSFKIFQEELRNKLRGEIK